MSQAVVKERAQLSPQECGPVLAPIALPCAVGVLCLVRAAPSGCHSRITALWFKCLNMSRSSGLVHIGRSSLSQSNLSLSCNEAEEGGYFPTASRSAVFYESHSFEQQLKYFHLSFMWPNPLFYSRSFLFLSLFCEIRLQRNFRHSESSLPSYGSRKANRASFALLVL